MHPRLAELIEYIDLQADVLRDAYNRVPPNQRHVRVDPDRWSAAENVHHIVIVERRMAARIAQLIEEARQHPPESETSAVLPKINTARVVARDARFKTSEASEPRDTNPDTVIEEFNAGRDALKAVIMTGDGLALDAVHAPHPALGELSVYGWIAFAGAHAARHAAQIDELFPAN